MLLNSETAPPSPRKRPPSHSVVLMGLDPSDPSGRSITSFTVLSCGNAVYGYLPSDAWYLDHDHVNDVTIYAVHVPKTKILIGTRN